MKFTDVKLFLSIALNPSVGFGYSFENIGVFPPVYIAALNIGEFA